MHLLRVGDVAYNLDHVRKVRLGRKGAPGKTADGRDAPIERDGVQMEWSDGRHEYLWDAAGLDAWAAIGRLCDDAERLAGDDATGPPVTPPDLDTARRMAWRLVAWLEGRGATDPGSAAGAGARELAERLDALCAAAAPADDDGDESGPPPAYTIRQAGGGPRGADPTEGPYRDLGELYTAAGRMAYECRYGQHPIFVDGEPWGTLRIASRENWGIRSADGSVAIAPGAIIL